MTLSNIILGLATGIPVMVAVGPIALLLIEAGLERGFRRSYPAAIGVASADAMYASLSAVAGLAAARYLEPFSGALQAVAVGLLLVLAVRLARSALGELRTPPVPVLVGADGSPTGGGTTLPPAAADEGGRLALAGGFFGLTAVNPLTIAVFATIVVGGGAGTGTLGWVVGMMLASLAVHMGFVAIGHGLGAVLDDTAVARLRLGAAALIVAMAVHFALA